MTAGPSLSEDQTTPQARFSLCMARDEKTGREKKVTAATADAPQEEFISPTNVPSVPETNENDEPKREEGEPPRN